MAVNNDLNISVTGIINADGAGAFSGTTTTNHRVLLGGASSNISAANAGSTGQLLQSAGAADPTWSIPTYPGTSGSVGKILRADGTNIGYSTPTYPNTATSTGTVLRADGTNWVASTATFPDTAGASGNVLVSDGTNWVSTQVASGWLVASVTLTSSQVKNLTTTPIQIVGLSGAGKVYVVLTVIYKLVYGGTTPFVAAGANVVITQNGVALTAAVGTGVFTSTANEYVSAGLAWTSINAASTVENQTLTVKNTGTAITGDVANDSSFVVTVYYMAV